jgi:hypothetical protein
MRMRALRWSAACLAGGVFVQSVQAQVGSLAGRVFTDSSAVPLVGVEVAIPSAQRTVRTDNRGAFRITGLAPGRYLVLRMPGYVPVTDTVTIDFDTEVGKDYRLTATITALDSVHVSATSPGLSARMRTFERRRAMGIGSFIAPEELRKKEEITLRFVLARLPGLRFYVWKCDLRCSDARLWIAESPRSRSVGAGKPAAMLGADLPGWDPYLCARGSTTWVLGRRAASAQH